MAYIIVGLGNPGEEYENTRHNTGRIIAALVAKNLDAKAKLVVPDTFMNHSGQAVGKVVKSQKAAEQLIVIHDDLDLPLGRFKIVFDRGAGGHHGVESIIKQLKTQKFTRTKVGISPTTPGGKLKKPKGEKTVDFIIGPFKPAELTLIKKEARKITEAIDVLIADSREKAMTLFNSQ